VHSLDPSENAITILQDKYTDTSRFKVGYSHDIPFPDDLFDLVVMSEVMEHLDVATLEQTTKELARIIKKDGVLIGTVPAREDLGSQMVMCPHCNAIFHRWGHLQTFNCDSIASALNSNFVVLRAEERLFITWALLNWKGKLAAFAKLVLHKLGLHGQGENIFFVCKKRCF
jgi:ubiquinone/menaquinone biosynthesis C-methylase UbiE